MLQKTAVLLVSLCVFSLLGCGSDNICDKADHASQNLVNAAASCPQFGGGFGGVGAVSTYNKATCQAAVGRCTGADQQALSNAFDCLAKINRCVPGQENQFLGSVFACLVTAGSISQACQTAFSG